MSMNPIIRTLTLAGLFALSACSGFFKEEATRSETMKKESLWSLSAPGLEGDDVDLEAYQGRVAVVVNVASECGFTPQYADLQTLQERYADRGLVVMGFPSNEFGGQEPGSAAEIRQFCSREFGVEFPMFAKVQTAEGAGQSPVYAMLGGATGSLPGWNFGKYVVSRDGTRARFFDSRTGPLDEDFIAAIEEELGEG